MQANMPARWLLVAGLAYVFLFFGIDKLVRPILWIGWIPPWLEGVGGATRNQWLSLFGVVEIVLACLLLVPERRVRRSAAALVAVYLVAVLTQNGVFTDIGVRDTGLLISAIALFSVL